MKTVTYTKKTLNDPVLIDMFNQMVGTGSINPDIVIPKYTSILNDCTVIIELFRSTFVDSNLISSKLFKDFYNSLWQIKEFCLHSGQEIKMLTAEKKTGVLCGDTVKNINKDPESVYTYLRGLEYDYDIDDVSEKYKLLKECSTVSNIVVAARDLRVIVENSKKKNAEYHDLENVDHLSDNFINNCDGEFLQLIPSISVMDFKQVWLHDDCTKYLRSSIIQMLHVFLEKSMNIVKNIMSPDIDVDKFSAVLIENISNLRKLIPRCDGAFDRIEKSLDLFKNNFNGYYKDFVTSKNPGIIIENFVMDVAASNTNKNIRLKAQFLKIVSYYKKTSMGLVSKDPNITKLLDLISSNLEKLEDDSGVNYKKKKDPVYQRRHEEVSIDNDFLKPPVSTKANKRGNRKSRQKSRDR